MQEQDTTWVLVRKRWHVQGSPPNVALCGQELVVRLGTQGWTNIPGVPRDACAECAGRVEELDSIRD